MSGKIRQRLEAATPGPWRAFRSATAVEGWDEWHVVNEGRGYPNASLEGVRAEADAEFIAHAREDVERLLAELAEEREWRIRLQQSEEREHNRFLTVAEAAEETFAWLQMAMGWAVFRDESRVYASNEMRDIQARIEAALTDLRAALAPGGGTAPHDCKPLPGRPLPGPANPPGVCELCGYDASTGATHG